MKKTLAAKGERETTSESKYDIAREWKSGYLAQLQNTARPADESPQWLAGWDAAQKMRPERDRRLSEYLASIGAETMGVVRAQTFDPPWGDLPDEQ